MKLAGFGESLARPEEENAEQGGTEMLWKLVPSGGIVLPNERLPWPQTIGIGMQHVVAMFGATFLVPLITGFPPTTTILFSGIGTLLFLVVTRN